MVQLMALTLFTLATTSCTTGKVSTIAAEGSKVTTASVLTPRPLPEGSEVTIDDTANTITINIPYDGNSSLCFAPEIKTHYSKAIVTPASGVPQDFTHPVKYTVDQDGFIKNYIVSVNVFYIPESYIWDGNEYVGWVGDRYVYYNGNRWYACGPEQMARFHEYGRSHPDWRSRSYRYERDRGPHR